MSAPTALGRATPPDRRAPQDLAGAGPPSIGEQAAPAAVPGGVSVRVLGRRRRFLVDPARQIRAALLTAVVTGSLLLLLNLAAWSLRSQEVARVAEGSPALQAMLHSQDRSETWILMLGSLTFVGAVFLVTILESHRTAGALINLRQRIDDLRDGRYASRLRLRRGDSLVAVEEPFNELARTLALRADRTADRLRDLAERAEAVCTPAEAREVAERLRCLAAEQTTRLDAGGRLRPAPDRDR